MFSNQLKNHNLNFKPPKLTNTDFTDRIRNISRMIDYMARERSKNRKSKKRTHARSVAR